MAKPAVAFDFAEFCATIRTWTGSPILARAARSHSSRHCYWLSRLAATMLDAPAPAELIDQARNSSAVQSLARRAREGMLLTSPKGNWEFRFGLNTHDKWLHRLLPIKAFLTTRTVGDHQAMPLPKSLWGLYYLTRPFRLASHVAKDVVRRCRRTSSMIMVSMNSKSRRLLRPGAGGVRD